MYVLLHKLYLYVTHMTEFAKTETEIHFIEMVLVILWEMLKVSQNPANLTSSHLCQYNVN